MVVTHSSAETDQQVDQPLQGLVVHGRVRIRLVSVENQHYLASGCSTHFVVAAEGEQGTHWKPPA
jgi:hypothetical protein